jgi:hypothetical protein
VAAPLDQILYNHGDNLFRLRIFVNPQTTYTTSSSGAMQTQAYDIALAQQIKANDPNARFLLDFHYSDTWADPGHQSLPAAWAGQSLAQLQSTNHAVGGQRVAGPAQIGLGPLGRDHHAAVRLGPTARAWRHVPGPGALVLRRRVTVPNRDAVLPR